MSNDDAKRKTTLISSLGHPNELTVEIRFYCLRYLLSGLLRTLVVGARKIDEDVLSSQLGVEFHAGYGGVLAPSEGKQNATAL